MNEQITAAAIQAVFHHQLTTERAIRYVTTNTNATAAQAKIALREIMTRTV